MTTDLMQKFLASSALNPGSMSYLEALYETYLTDPSALDTHLESLLRCFTAGHKPCA